MKKHFHYLSLLVLFFLLPIPTFSQRTINQCDFCDNKCSYETVNGRITGHYISWYSNGRKKAEGYLQNGYHIGGWTVWDSNGVIKTQRDYYNPLVFKTTYPETLSKSSNNVLYYPIKNEDGIIPYYNLKAGQSIIRQKIWRDIYPLNNELLFTGDLFFDIIKKSLDTLTAFDVVDDRFTTPLTTGQLKVIYDNNDVIAYKLKEEFIYDKDRLLSEYRILGICPVGKNKISGDTSAMFWIYYPDFRTILANMTINEKKLPNYITSYDDLFFYRYFSSSINKSTMNNPYDLPIASYPGMIKENIAKEALSTEMNLLETEHDQWISVSGIQQLLK